MNTSRKYARNRHFVYPSDHNVSVCTDQETQEELTDSIIENDAEPVLNRSFNTGKFTDPYLNMAESCFLCGQMNEALEYWGHSLTKCHNPYAVKRIGDYFQLILLLEYHQHGFSNDAGKSAQSAVGMYLMYAKLTGQFEVVEKDFESLIQKFGHLEEFNAILQQVQNKIDALDEDEIIKQFYNGGI